MKSIAKQALLDWLETYRTDKKLFWAELFGTILGMIAATMLGIYAANPPMVVVLTTYTVSSVLIVYAMYKRKSTSPMILMMFYTLVNIIGLFRL